MRPIRDAIADLRAKLGDDREPVLIRFLPNEPPTYWFERRDNRVYADAVAEKALDWVQKRQQAGDQLDACPFDHVSPYDDKIRRKFYLNAQPMLYRWVKPPRRPTKIAGRKGTKRAWKRANPPKFKSVPDGPVRVAVIGAAAMHKLQKLLRPDDY